MHAQNLLNGDLDGSGGGMSNVPTNWEQVPFTDPLSNATSAYQATSDKTTLTGPQMASGINGNPYSGANFVSGLHAYSPNDNWLWREGIMQSVSGFTPGNDYEIKFHQAVVKQYNCLDSSGSWAVIADGVLLDVTAPTFSNAPFNSNSFVWEQRSVVFQASSTTHVIKFLPTDDDQYISMLLNGGAGLRMGIDSISINPYVVPTPIVSLGIDTTLCQGDTLYQDVACTGCSYIWNDGSTSSFLNITSTGTYSVEVTNSIGSSFDTVNVTFVTEPTVTLGIDTTLCSGDFIVLDATQNFNVDYLWQDGSSSSSLNVSQAGQYSVLVNNLGCTAADTITINTLPMPSVMLNVNDTTLCVGDQIQIAYSGTNIDQIFWSDGSSSPLLTTTSDTIYTIEANNICGQDFDTLVINFVAQPVVNLGADTLFCDTVSIILDVSQTQYMSYQWQDGTTGSTLLVNQSGQYSVSVNNSGCTAFDTINVTFLSSPEITLIASSSTLCDGEQVQLEYTGIGVDNVTWSDGSTNQVFLTNTDSIYWVNGFNSCGQDSDSIEIDFVDYPIIDLGADTILCEGNTLILSGNQLPGYENLWQNGSTNPAIDVVQSGLYSIQVSNGDCISYDTINVTFQSVPTFTLPPDTSICSSDDFFLEIDNNNYDLIQWNSGSNEMPLLINQEGLYILELSNSCGTASDSILIQHIDCQCTLYIPNSFSPDHDGVNDAFQVQYECDDMVNYELNIFNRWGEIIFTSRNINDSWNGTYRGSPVQEGVYLYHIKYGNLTVIADEFTGHINLVK